MRTGGRRPGLVFAYGAGVAGSLLVVTAVWLGSVPLLFLGTFLFGGASAANLQSRYAAVDLADRTAGRGTCRWWCGRRHWARWWARTWRRSPIG